MNLFSRGSSLLLAALVIIVLSPPSWAGGSKELVKRAGKAVLQLWKGARKNTAKRRPPQAAKSTRPGSVRPGGVNRSFDNAGRRRASSRSSMDGTAKAARTTRSLRGTSNRLGNGTRASNSTLKSLGSAIKSNPGAAAALGSAAASGGAAMATTTSAAASSSTVLQPIAPRPLDGGMRLRFAEQSLKPEIDLTDELLDWIRYEAYGQLARQGVELATSGFPEIDKEFHRELAAGHARGEKEFYVKACKNNKSQLYGIHSSRKKCLNGDEPLGFRSPVNLRPKA